MDRRRRNYFSNYSLTAFLEVHRQISGGLKHITNPTLEHAVANYRVFIDEFEKVIMIPASRDITGDKAERNKAYRSLYKAVSALMEVDFADDMELYKTLKAAFGENIYRYYANDVTETIHDAVNIISKVPMESLAKFGLQKRVQLLQELNSRCDQTDQARAHNLKAEKTSLVSQARKNLSGCFRCLMDLVEAFARQGDEGCKQFLKWMKEL